MIKKFIKVIEEIVKKCNVFKSPVCLRYQFDAQYDTFLGGFLTIFLITFFYILFFGTWVQLFNKNNIKAITKTLRDDDPNYSKIRTNQFVFAVGFFQLNLNNQQLKQYFNVTMYKNKMSYSKEFSKQQIKLQPCRLQHWQSYGLNFVNTFKLNDLSKFLCPPTNLNLQIRGKFTSQLFQFYQISVEKCNGNNCADSNQVNQLLSKNDGLNLNFLYPNTLINPQQQNPTTMVFQDQDYIRLSNSLGTISNIYLGQYQIKTDQSLAPWDYIQIEKGFIVNRPQKQWWTYNRQEKDSYAKLFIRKSNTKYQYYRSFIKIDQTLSYIGGLFGMISILVDFFMNYYTQCSLELQLCQKFFDYKSKSLLKKDNEEQLNKNDKNSKKYQSNKQNNSKNDYIEQSQDQQHIEPSNFGIFDFLCHIFYQLISKFYKFKWERMQIYADSLQQMKYKLDVGQLIQKLAFYDRAISALFSQSQLKLLYLQQKFNFKDMRNQRKMLSLRDQVVKYQLDKIIHQTNIKKNNDEISLNNYQKFMKIQRNYFFNNQKQEYWMQNKKHKQKEKINNQKRLTKKFLKTSNLDKQQQKHNKIKRFNSQVNLSPQIIDSLIQLQKKIQSNDEVAIRIYNNLQIDLVKQFQSSKLKTSSYRRLPPRKKQHRNLKLSNLIHQVVSEQQLNSPQFEQNQNMKQTPSQYIKNEQNLVQLNSDRKLFQKQIKNMKDTESKIN